MDLILVNKLVKDTEIMKLSLITKQPDGRVVTVKQVLSIAQYMADVGYLPTEPLAIVKIAKPGDLDSHIITYGQALKACTGFEADGKLKLTVDGKVKELPVSVVLTLLDALPTDDKTAIADGRTRALAVAMATVFGADVKPFTETVPLADYDRISLAGNVAKGFVARLSGDGAVTQIIALHSAGKIEKESDCTKFGLKRGLSQRAFYSAVLVNHKGLALADVLTLRGNTKAKKVLDAMKAGTAAVDALASATDDTTEGNGGKPLSKVAILELAKLATGDLARLIYAIATGNDITAKAAIKTLTTS